MLTWMLYVAVSTLLRYDLLDDLPGLTRARRGLGHMESVI
jgi:hypothetical protein